MTALRIATWNINSLRLRLPLLERLVAALDPDVICLQETKVPDELFPDAGPPAPRLPARRPARHEGLQRRRHPVPHPAAWTTTRPDWCERGDCRHLQVRCRLPSGPVELHDFYVPAGGDMPDPAVERQVRAQARFRRRGDRLVRRPAGLRRAVLVGDLNIAPLEQDVWSHKQLLGVVSHTPVEVAHMLAWQRAGWHDALRHFVPAEQKLYTWWSYRNRDWRASDRGRRLDHIWVTPDLAPALRAMTVLKDARDWPQTSDHVPVAVTLEV